MITEPRKIPKIATVIKLLRKKKYVGLDKFKSHWVNMGDPDMDPNTNEYEFNIRCLKNANQPLINGNQIFIHVATYDINVIKEYTGTKGFFRLKDIIRAISRCATECTKQDLFDNPNRYNLQGIGLNEFDQFAQDCVFEYNIYKIFVKDNHIWYEFDH